MVICFEEKDREIIEERGITIIEYKQQLYNMIKTITDKAVIAWEKFIEKFLEAVDSVKLVLEQIMEAYSYPTSRRYRIVKVFSKCTYTDIHFAWRLAGKIIRWRARSNC